MFIDLEVQNHPFCGSIASPKNPENWVVMEGQAIDYEPYGGEVTYVHNPKLRRSNWLKIPDDVWLLVGHNISFELDWIQAEHWEELSKFINRGGRVWCTQLAEYRLSRQEHIYPSLNDTCVRYGGNVKLDLVSAQWKAGKLTSEIDPKMLKDYLCGTDEMEGDIGNTRLAFYGQWQQATERGMLNAILEQNNALLYNAVCMFNGLKIDMSIAKRNLKALEDRIEEIETSLRTCMLKAGVSQQGVEAFKMGSDFHKSAIVYGGTYQFDARVPSIDKDGNYRYEKQDVVFEDGSKTRWIVVDPEGDLEAQAQAGGIEPTRYKSGKRKGEIKVERIDSDAIKMVNGKVQEDLKGVVDLTVYSKEFQEGFKSKYTGKRELQDGTDVYSTSEDAINELLAQKKTSKDAQELLSLFREWAILNKVIGSFFDKQEYYANGAPKKRSGIFQYVTPEGLIHHSLNVTATKTGRLSSTRPNMQQIPRDDRKGVMASNVKEMFVSRFGDQGRLVEVDYNALEVRVMADFTGDENLAKAVLDGTDMHSLRAGAFHGIPYEDFNRIRKDPTHPDYDQYCHWRQDIKAPSFALT